MASHGSTSSVTPRTVISAKRKVDRYSSVVYIGLTENFWPALNPPRDRGGSNAASFRKAGGTTTSYSAFWTMVLGWLVRLVPVLEERNAMLPSGPVAFRVRFPDIETFSQRDSQVAETPVAPTVAVEDGQIAIDCVTRYLRCFLSAGNLGDRLMIASLVRGVDLLCGNQAVSDVDMDEWVHNVVGSDSARFLKMTPSQTPEDVIYDVAALPKLRLLMPEDRAWSRMDLARRAGYDDRTRLYSVIPGRRASQCSGG